MNGPSPFSGNGEPIMPFKLPKPEDRETPPHVQDALDRLKAARERRARTKNTQPIAAIEEGVVTTNNQSLPIPTTPPTRSFHEVKENPELEVVEGTNGTIQWRTKN